MLMKKRNIIGLICIGIIVLMIIGSIFYSKNDKNTQENNSVTFLADKTNDCKGNKIYAKMSNYQIISYCLDNIKITDSNTKDLVDYLNNNNIIKVVDSWSKKVLNNNNGTLYYNNDYKIVKCNLDDNKNLYVGTNEMPIDDLCTKSNEDLTFKRTYQVLNITDSDTEEYWYLTLKEYQVDDVVTVKVKKEINPNLKEKRSYVFEFAYNGTCITDVLNWILENAEIVSIKQTDKIGMDAIRDEVNACN